jgi:hypothetical protein
MDGTTTTNNYVMNGNGGVAMSQNGISNFRDGITLDS